MIIISGFNNDYKPSFNGRGGFQKRNDFRNDRNGDQQQSGGFYRAKPDYQPNDDFGGNRGGYRSVNFIHFDWLQLLTFRTCENFHF